MIFLLIHLYSILSEEAFSVAGHIVVKKRNCLEAITLQLLMLTKASLGFTEYEKEEYTKELLGEEGDYEADGEGTAVSEDREDFVMD